MDPFTLALLAGGALLLLKGKQSPPAPHPQQEQPSTSSETAPPVQQQEPPKPSVVPNNISTDAVVGALITATVGKVGQSYADTFTGGFQGSKGIASKIATPLGATIGGGGFALLGGTSGALAITGGAVLPAAALVVVPAIVLTVIILSYVQIAENKIKQQQFVDSYNAVYSLIGQKKYSEAWAKAVEA